MTNSEINIQQIDQTPSKKKFVTKPIPPSKLTFKHKAAFTASTASTAVTSGEQTAHIYEAESSPSSLGSGDDPSYVPGEEHKVKQKYEKYQKMEPKSGKKSFKKKNLKSKPGSILDRTQQSLSLLVLVEVLQFTISTLTQVKSTYI